MCSGLHWASCAKEECEPRISGRVGSCIYVFKFRNPHVINVIFWFILEIRGDVWYGKISGFEFRWRHLHNMNMSQNTPGSCHMLPYDWKLPGWLALQANWTTSPTDTASGLWRTGHCGINRSMAKMSGKFSEQNTTCSSILKSLPGCSSGCLGFLNVFDMFDPCFKKLSDLPAQLLARPKPKPCSR